MFVLFPQDSPGSKKWSQQASAMRSSYGGNLGEQPSLDRMREVGVTSTAPSGTMMKAIAAMMKMVELMWTELVITVMSALRKK